MPRRQRSKANRNREIGINNRQGGMCRKAHDLFTQYKADVVVIIRRPDGRLGGYQSKRGLVRQLLKAPEDCLITPRNVGIDNIPQPIGKNLLSSFFQIF